MGGNLVCSHLGKEFDLCVENRIREEEKQSCKFLFLGLEDGRLSERKKCQLGQTAIVLGRTLLLSQTFNFIDPFSALRYHACSPAVNLVLNP